MNDSIVKEKSSSTRELLRQSGKRVDQLMGSSDQFITASVIKEGLLFIQQEPNQKKWKPFYFLLCPGVLYWKHRESSTSIKGEVELKCSKIERTTTITKTEEEGDSPGNLYTFNIIVNDKVFFLATEKESTLEEWIKEINEHAEKVPTTPLTSRKGTRILRAQKRIGGTIATTAGGKKIIKEALGTEGYRGVTIVKKVSKHLHGKKKATEIEETIIRIGVKIILLAKNKDLKLADLIRHRDAIKVLCEHLSHNAQFTFDYNAVTTQNEIEVFKKDVLQTLQKFLSPKNIASLVELFDYVSAVPFLDTLFTGPIAKEWRKEWHYLMKDIIAKLDIDWAE